MAKAYVSDRRMPYLRKVFERDGIEFTECVSEGGGFLVRAGITNSRFREVLADDCLCEMEREKYGGVPVYSLETVTNPGKLARLMRANRTDVFVMLSRDRENYLHL